VVINNNGDWINREEYSPYGETSFGSFAKKRYRFTGKERDEESGLAYHGARYYAPWLARWVSCDPASPIDGINTYAYARNSPVIRHDLTGRQSSTPEQQRVNQDTLVVDADTDPLADWADPWRASRTAKGQERATSEYPPDAPTAAPSTATRERTPVSPGERLESLVDPVSQAAKRLLSGAQISMSEPPIPVKNLTPPPLVEVPEGIAISEIGETGIGTEPSPRTPSSTSNVEPPKDLGAELSEAEQPPTSVGQESPPVSEEENRRPFLRAEESLADYFSRNYWKAYRENLPVVVVFEAATVVLFEAGFRAAIAAVATALAPTLPPLNLILALLVWSIIALAIVTALLTLMVTVMTVFSDYVKSRRD